GPEHGSTGEGLLDGQAVPGQELGAVGNPGPRGGAAGKDPSGHDTAAVERVELDETQAEVAAGLLGRQALIAAREAAVAVGDAPGGLGQGPVPGGGIAAGGGRGDARRGGGAARAPVDALPGGEGVARGEIAAEGREGIGPGSRGEIER